MAESNVRRRIKNLKRQILLKITLLTQNLKIKEPVDYDGFETFVGSQYDPNNINLAVGKNSLFILDFIYSPLNRKGRMTDFQRKKLQKIVQQYGRYASYAVRDDTKTLFQNLLKRKVGDDPILLYTDDHQTPSSQARNGKNPLFAVNNTHLQLRHNLAACRGETIAFAKHEMGPIDKIILIMPSGNILRSGR